jgi:predicted ester cyclase
MTSDATTAPVRRLIDAHNRHDVEAAIACFTLDATNHGRRVGREGMARVYTSLYTAFPDFHFETERLIADSEWVTAQITMSGTHLGMPELPVLGGLLNGVAPTGKAVRVHNIHIYRLSGGLIADHHAVRDDLGMMQQLGLLPPTDHPAGDMSRRGTP